MFPTIKERELEGQVDNVKYIICHYLKIISAKTKDRKKVKKSVGTNQGTESWENTTYKTCLLGKGME